MDENPTDNTKPAVSRLAGGWGKTAWDLLRAIRYAKLNPLERSLLDEAMELSWRPSLLAKKHDATPFQFNLSDLARAFEADRLRLREARDRLIAKNILTVTDDEFMLINKDYRTWKALDGSPLLSPTQIGHAVKIIKTDIVAPPPRNNRQRGASSATMTVVTVESTPCLRRATTPVCAALPPLSAPRYQVQSSPQTPIEEAPASEELIQELREKNTSNSRVPISAKAARAEEIFDWTLAKMRECYPGDDSLAEVVTIRAREWVRDEGYSVSDVMSAVNNAIRAGIGGGGFIKWAHKNLIGARERPSASGSRAPAPEPFEEYPRLVMDEFEQRLYDAMLHQTRNGRPN